MAHTQITKSTIDQLGHTRRVARETAQVEYDDYEGCMCGDDECPECGGAQCSYCGGDGWGEEGEDWDCDDPLWIAPGTIRKCPNCGGSGEAKDMTFW